MIVFDLDGTLSDLTHRLRHVQGSERDYPTFHRACIDDTPIAPLIKVLGEMYHEPLKYAAFLSDRSEKVMIWTGRSDIALRQTLEWGQKHLPKNFLSDVRRIRMRQHGDRRPTHQIKQEWLHELRAQGDNVSLVFEDSQKVVDMWRSENVMCCQVAEGKF